MIDVAGCGASSIDLVYMLPAAPSPEGPNSKLQVRSHFASPGGQTATAMAACAALGLRAAFLGATGNDAYGAAVRDALARRGVDLTKATTAPYPQPHALILIVDGHGERIVLWHRPEEFPAVDYAGLAPAIREARVVHVDDTDDAGAITAATLARDAGRMVTTDIDRVTPRTKALLALATHPVMAEHVPGMLTGERDLPRALRRLRDVTAAPLVVTRGAAGALALEGNTLIEAAGFEVQAVDTTGAGDIFRAGFIAALLEDAPLAGALRFANAAAAASCTKPGAMASVPSRGEVARLLRQAERPA